MQQETQRLQDLMANNTKFSAIENVQHFFEERPVREVIQLMIDNVLQGSQPRQFSEEEEAEFERLFR